MSQPSAPTEEPAPEGSRVASRLLEQPLRNLGVGVTAIVLGTTAAFGGLEEAQGSAASTDVVVGRTMTADPFDITIRRLLWVSELPGFPTSAEGNRWLAIVADVKNTSDETLLPYYAKEALTVSDVEGLPKPPEMDLTTTIEDDRTDRVGPDQLVHFPDSTQLSPLQPGMTYQAVYLYEQKADAEPAQKVTVQLVAHTLRPNSFDQVEMWLDPVVKAESSLAVLPPEKSADAQDDTNEETEAAAG
ncbi:hypothetical protein LWF15_27205 [Kineosporia rhizophila]|uniref:hypothetical protein n=1 Tax=Kineosporia TaxID=49184 RepID=UPI001E483FBB|nr:MULTISPECIES: hypothetical protein [Kineosporia]MCE0539194.1 hypothetical protein [Kineosporia rhizophila]GLY18041.1 hypothetical protein Kisp01_50550 [Kineosporia sp. NBRC 101677]